MPSPAGSDDAPGRARLYVAVLCEARPVAIAVPSWVSPSEQQVKDCLALVTRAVAGTYAAGVSASLRWVVGLTRTPLTGQDLAASPTVSEKEFFVAGKVELGESPLSAVVSPDAAQGVGRTLSWLLGWETRPPVELPRRPSPTAEQLYEEALSSQPWKYDLPEEQTAARLAAQREAVRLSELAARADAQEL